MVSSRLSSSDTKRLTNWRFLQVENFRISVNLYVNGDIEGRPIKAHIRTDLALFLHLLGHDTLDFACSSTENLIRLCLNSPNH